MKNYLIAIKNGALAFWHAFRGHPLANARTAHLDAVRTLYRANAEVAYHAQLVAYFDDQAASMDPHDDWHLFAQLKDKWQEHLNEKELEHRKLKQAQGKMDASFTRLTRLEQQP